MRILFFGSGAFGVPSLSDLCRSNHEVCAVVTQPDRKSGRGRRSKATPIKDLAIEHGLTVIQPPDVNAEDAVGRAVSLQPDLAVVAAFGQRLGPALLAGLNHRAINLHASLLPKYRGAAPINWAIINGEQETGLTVFRLAEGMDTGAILVQHAVPILPDETAAELHDRLASLGPELVRTAVEMFADQADPGGQQQDDSQASPAPKLGKSDGRIRFDQPAEQVARRIRGLWSWPGASCDFVSAESDRTEKVILARARPAQDTSGTPGQPGTVGDDLTVGCAEGSFELLELKPAGGRLMAFKPDFVNGRRVKAGDRFVALG
jgi:methionyl-tRNA formyltransferase